MKEPTQHPALLIRARSQQAFGENRAIIDRSGGACASLNYSKYLVIRVVVTIMHGGLVVSYFLGI